MSTLSSRSLLMNLFTAPQVIINEDTHPRIAQTLAFLAVGGGRDEIGMGDWLAENRMRINCVGR